MKRDTVAEIELSVSARKRPRGQFLVQTRLRSDGPEHPYGQWSMVVEPVAEIEGEPPEKLLAFVAFISPEAPASALKRGEPLQLFNGVNPIGKALVVHSKSDRATEDLQIDRDFLSRSEAA